MAVNRQALINAINRAIARDDVSVMSLPGSALGYISEESLVSASQETRAIVEEALRAQPEFRIFDGGWVSHARGGYRIELRSVADWLLAQSLKPNGASDVVRRVSDFVEANRADAVLVNALAGIRVDSEVEIYPGIKLVPFDNLPPSGQRNMFSGRQIMFRLGPSYTVATAALTATTSISPAIRDSVAARIPRSGFMEESRRLENAMHEIRRCLTLIGPCGPVEVAWWGELRSNGFPPSPGASYSSNLFTGPGVTRQFKGFDAEAGTRLVSKYMSLPADLRTALHVPLERLGQSIREPSDVDAAIDLGVALESLLMHGEGSQGELTFKLSMRGAWLSSDDPELRKANLKLLKAAYSLRSRAVHVGMLPERNRGEATAEILHRSIELCAALIIRIIENGRRPDWQNLVLGDRDA